jgi:hypothetical protein
MISLKFDVLFWDRDEARIQKYGKRSFLIKLWRIAKPRLGFAKDIVRVLRIDY